MREWISTSLGPTLHASGYGHVKMIISDQVRHYLTEYVEGVRTQTKQYLSNFYNDFHDLVAQFHCLLKFIFYKPQNTTMVTFELNY